MRLRQHRRGELLLRVSSMDCSFAAMISLGTYGDWSAYLAAFSFHFPFKKIMVKQELLMITLLFLGLVRSR